MIKDLGLRPQVNGHSRRWYQCSCECGNLKEVQGNLLKQGQTSSCGKCLTSKGEAIILKLLEELNIIYNQEVIDPLLVKETGRKLRFDFAIYNTDGSINRYIEFDGRQHFDGPDTNYWGHSNDTIETIREKDKIKNQFCLTHNIPLVRIPYWVIPTKENLFSDKYLVKGDDYCD